MTRIGPYFNTYFSRRPEAPPSSKKKAKQPVEMPAPKHLTDPSGRLAELKIDILSALRAKERYAEADLKVLEESFNFMVRFHEKETLPHGERTVIHLLEVARTLALWGADAIVVSAGLLHLASLEKLENEGIDKRVCYLVRRKNALEPYLFARIEGEISPREAGYLTEMCLIQEGDKNVWLLEAADELRTLSSLIDVGVIPSRAYHVTSSILKWFDLDNISLKLEDLALFRLDPQEYQRLEDFITKTNREVRKNHLEDLRILTEFIGTELTATGLKFRVQVDVKSVARAKTKLERGESLTDGGRFRFIIDGPKEQCIQAMRTVQKEMQDYQYTEILSERKNYIGGIKIGETEENYDKGPKPNGYQSLHLHFRGKENEPINVQIRTQEMHEWAELGGASHGRFKLNGLIDTGTIDEASTTRQKLISEGRRYAFYDGKIYRLVPYRSEKPATLLDLAFAASPDLGLRSPDKITIERINPETGGISKEKGTSILTALQNGDRTIHSKRGKTIVLRRARFTSVATLPAILSMKMARERELDPETIDQRASTARTNGEIAVEAALLEWRGELLKLLRKKLGAKAEEFALYISTRLEPAVRLLNLESVDELHLAVGLSKNREKIIARLMNEVKTSSLFAAYRAADNEVDIRMLVYDAPSTLPAVFQLFDRDELISMRTFSFKPIRPSTPPYALIKASFRSRAKNPELGTLLTESGEIYQQIQPKPEGVKYNNARIDIQLNRCSPPIAQRISEIIQKQGGNITSVTIEKRKGNNFVCCFNVSVPRQLPFETYTRMVEKNVRDIRTKGIGKRRYGGLRVKELRVKFSKSS
jgi:(p)ppGpp synthase/HD superfamily hydrolase